MFCLNKKHPQIKKMIERLGETQALYWFNVNKGNPLTDEDMDEIVNTKKIKPGVEELFESNESLANAVYEALGFTESISLESNLKNTGKTEQELIEYLKKKYPEIKLNITDSPQWEQDDNVFNQSIEDEINTFELFEDQDKLCPSGICNYTARASTEHLQKIGLNPYPSNYNGSQLPVTVKSPIGDFNIEHYVSAVAINNVIYIYDMPQNEFISNEFFGKDSDVKVKESYKPRLIPLTIDEIKANYNLSTKEAGNFIHSIISNKGWEGADAAPSFKTYIENNIKNPQEYINLLETQIKDSGYEFKQWDVEEYRREVKDKRNILKTKKVTKEEEQKVIKYYENKLKLKTKEYLPKRADKFSLKTLVDSVIGRGFDSSIDFSSFENALQSLDNYLKSENFIEDLLIKTQSAEENLNSVNKSIEQVYALSKLFASFTKQVKVYGIEEALKKYDSKQQYTIRTLLPSNVLDKYKSKEQAALLLQKYWGNKDNIVKQLNIYKTKTFTDLITNKFKAYSIFNKYQTVLNFLKSTDFDSSYLYEVISNEAIRKYSYFDKIGNTQFQKDEFNRIIGQANIKAMTVLVDAVNKKADTIPHEYAHHYIAWFRDTPIVQEGIRRFGSEEALVQSIGEQVVKQKGEAFDWWNKFIKWILSKLNSLSELKKEELTQILTDAFLNRENLNQTEIKPGVEELFESNPELANIGTPELYSQYLDSLNKLNTNPILQGSQKVDVILPIGTSGSGKSTFIKSLPQENLVVIEPDAMRVEFTGDMNNKSKDKEIYEEAANRAIQAIKQGKQVVFDTTNLTKDKRLPFIEAIKKAIPTANIQYKLMELNPELAKQRIKAQLARGENRAAVSDETIDRHAASYKQMLEDIKNEPISNFDVQQEQVKKFAELQERLNNKEFIEGAKFAYESTPALQQFGTQEQYNDYIARVSLGIIKNPTSGEYNKSQVKDIVYHGTKEKYKLEDFGKNNLGKNTGFDREKGYYFGELKNISHYVNDVYTEFDAETGEIYPVIKKVGSFIPAVLNNPIIVEEKDSDQFGYGYINEYNSFLIKDLKQIHILGSKQDIEGFTNFINKSDINLKSLNLTQEEWDSLTEEEKERIKNCYN